MRRYGLLIFSCCWFSLLSAQPVVKGWVADSATRQALAFATIRVTTGGHTFITNIQGRFSITATGNEQVTASYAGYRSRSGMFRQLVDRDTIFLVPRNETLDEVIVKPQADRVRRILGEAIRNKASNNPEKFERYRCNIYYKMKLDLEPFSPVAVDSTALHPGKAADTKRAHDTLPAFFRNNHLFLSETYSRRYYKKPQQLQEIVLASRFSGLKKTYFTNLVTDVLPFHVYGDYITMNEKDYVNPVAKGWPQRYSFYIADEIVDGSDTTFILEFQPRKGSDFNSLKGAVYINTKGYAITHFTAATTDTLSNREVRIEQVYQPVDGKWFPEELNYELLFKTNGSQPVALRLTGHSIIDSVSFSPEPGFRFDKTYPVRIDDSVDLRTPEEWQRFRRDSLSQRERSTYRVIDSISQKRNIEKMIVVLGKISIGRWPLGPVDLDITRLVASSRYEGVRIGAGFYTNDRTSRYFSVGAWLGYGFKDGRFKYGVSGTWYPKANKDNYFRFSFRDDYQNAGNVFIHPEVDRSGYQTWLLSRVDQVREYAMRAHTQRGYWELEAGVNRQHLTSRYDNNFTWSGKNYTELKVDEASIGVKYAYGQKRIPIFGAYYATGTRFPVVYFQAGIGKASSGEYEARFLRASAIITFNKHFNRWGKDAVRLEAGMVHAFDDAPLSRSLLLGAKGFRREGVNYYAWGGFLTMRPYDYFNDAYASLLYRHDFDKYLWHLKYSKPFIGVAHNILYGKLSEPSRVANAGIASTVNGYHESGLLINQLLQLNFVGAAYIYFNAGAFYHWAPSFDWKKNGVWVVGISAGF